MHWNQQERVVTTTETAPRAPDRDATASVRPATGLAQAQADPNRTLAGRIRRSFLGSAGSIVFGMEADSIVLHDRAI